MRLLLLGLLSLATIGCTNIFFLPWRGHVMTPDRAGLEYADVDFTAADGTPLHAWFLPARVQPALGTILVLHGNAENISTHIASVYWLPARGYNLLLLDYRGYGKSGGKPSLPGAQDDITSAMRMLLARPGVDPDRIVVLGQSLGGALAIYNVAHSPYRAHIRALVVESTFFDYRAIVREKLDSFWLTWPFQWPLSWTVCNDYSPSQAVAQVSPIPLLIVHGDRDNIVPSTHGERLYAAAREPKRYWRVAGGGHIGAWQHAEYRDRLVAYLHDVLEPERRGRP
jgi:fermentation-respiration switch protein FrsA (DUF1100 family)